MKEDIDQLPNQVNDKEYQFHIIIGNEIYRLKKRLLKMSVQVDDIKQLLKSIDRMQAILTEEGFEIIDLVNLNYDEGMTVKVRFVPTNDSTENNIISKVIKPQINYNGHLIQIADIEVKIFKA